MKELNRIYNQDFLQGIQEIEDKSVDMILTDLPYGTTNNKWDVIIPFDVMWEEFERVIKDNGAIVLTCSQPFTTKLNFSNLELFRYEYIWIKNNVTGFQNANRMPMKKHENISVFYKKLPTYNPQGLIKSGKKINRTTNSTNWREMKDGEYVQKYTNYPNQLIKASIKKHKDLIRFHPTQKPVELFEYLIKTYTNENEIVLDICMGSGTTAHACLRSNRQYIGFEKDKKYYDQSMERLALYHKLKEEYENNEIF
ncbi:site-specific DNA-methyltransferase [Mammaliicoccus lentus]|uniref:DNA-methyltransferase n=1 Tax=Mammaliicoccus lentus TaxID=42858 RepID=UPI0024A7E0B8|nr:site-specific DNA-methyltransferase [Mammaliicoccus lentus]WHI54183.1 site-specific DNA-methyltransferase [Mammaliicoccus lentus]